MKILMFGWEFPPEISGGLGTACFGIANNLSSMNDIDLSFVVPKNRGVVPKDYQIIDASNISVKAVLQHSSFKYFEIDSQLIPYTSPQEYWDQQIQNREKNAHFVAITANQEIKFSGNYPINLFDEVFNYAIAAHKIATNSTFDLIHVHDWMTFPAGIEAKQISGKPLIIHLHSTEYDRSPNHINPRIYAIEKEGMLAANKIVTVSESTQKLIVEKYGIEKNKVEVIYNGIDDLLRKNFNKTRKGFNEKLITFLGRITEQKGPEYFVKMAHQLILRNDDIRFVMAGDGDLLPQMVETIAKLGISNKFHFTGFLNREQVTQLLNMSDVYVLPSVSEPFGITVLEAIQAEVPVVASEQAGVCEVIQNISKVNCNNTNALSDSVEKLLHNTDAAKKLAKAAKKELQDRTWKTAAKQLQQLYLAILTQ